jgi:hypothetical protein
MSRLFGKVLVRETNAGIPNLVVSAFDQDPAARGDATGEYHRESPALGGSRLGSVITRADGSFELEYDPWTKGRPGSEIRADLVLAIFAPEDSAGPKDPKPLPPDQRMLHISRVARVDASSIEGYVVRISRAQLDEFGIGPRLDPSSQQSHINADMLAGSIEQSWALRDAVRKRLQPHVDREAKLAEERKKKAKAWVNKLVLVPEPLRGHPLFAADAKAAAKTHEQVVKDGLKRLKKHEPKFRVSMSEADLAALGFQKKDGKLEGKLALRKITSRLFAASGGPDLIRTRDFTDAIRNPERSLETIRERIASETTAAEKPVGDSDE